jgi:hypothetical protein
VVERVPELAPILDAHLDYMEQLLPGLGIAFDVTTLVGVPLFTDDRTRLAEEGMRARERLMLLPQRIRMPEPGPIDVPAARRRQRPVALDVARGGGPHLRR